jgi:hypothetical protein
MTSQRPIALQVRVKDGGCAVASLFKVRVVAERARVARGSRALGRAPAGPPPARGRAHGNADATVSQPRSFEDGKTPHDTTSRVEAAAVYCDPSGHARGFATFTCLGVHDGHSFDCPKTYHVTSDTGGRSVNRKAQRVYSLVSVRAAVQCAARKSGVAQPSCGRVHRTRRP